MRNTSQVGEIARTQVMAALARQGKFLLLPLSDCRRYDFVFEEGEKFFRVQCKTGHLARGAVVFNPCSVDSRSEKGRCIRKQYGGQVEFFGVYCPENHKVYLVPVSEAPSASCSLRITPARSGQVTGIRWARDFEVNPEEV